FISREATSDCALDNFFIFALNNPTSPQDGPPPEDPGGKTCGQYWLEQGGKPKKPTLYMARWVPPADDPLKKKPDAITPTPAPPPPPPRPPSPPTWQPPCCGKPMGFFKVTQQVLRSD